MRPQSTFAGIIAILGVAALWGGTFTAMKAAFYTADPMPFLFLRFLFALLVLLMVYAFRGVKPKFSKLGTLAGLTVFAGYALQMEGLTGISATKSAFITGLNVSLVPIFEFMFFSRRPKVRAILAITLGILGLALLTGAIHGIPLTTGDLLTIGCAVAWALQIVIVDRAVKGLEPIDLTFNESIPTLLLAAASSPLVGEFDLPLDSTVLMAALYTGVLATVLAFFLQAWAQRVISPESAALGLMAEPVFAYFFSWLILGEMLAPLQLLGAILILVSILLAS